MKRFYTKVILFWFVLLILALANATIRETTYKPLLAPIIGIWAHQISSLTGIILFFLAIYFFIKNLKVKHSTKDLLFAGILWIVMTVVFESGMNYFIRHLTLQQVIETYYFWKGDTWVFVLLSLVVSPLVASKLVSK